MLDDGGSPARTRLPPRSVPRPRRPSGVLSRLLSAPGVTPGCRSWFGVLIDSMLESWRNPQPRAIRIGVRCDSAVAEDDSRVLDMVFSSCTCLQRR